MITITEEIIEAAAPNADAAKNGRGLLLKNKFVALHHDEDKTLLFGSCQGSGKSPYLCSADFAVPDKPVYRCTCPSRQFPCKHTLGLMYAFAQGKGFTVAVVPEELAAKREKAAARVEKKAVEATQPRKVNKSALAKKIKAQLEGIDLLERLTQDLVRLGIGNMNAKTARELEEHAKQLGNAYLPGAQTALRNYTRLFYSADEEELDAARREAIYSEALDQLGRLHCADWQRPPLSARTAGGPGSCPETDTAIAAWLGHAWQLRELKDAGLLEENVELVQVAFHSFDDTARQEFVDTGVWMHLGNGRIHITQNYRPYRAVKHIKSDDSFFQVARISELCIYPGELNGRVRWEGMVARPIEPKDLESLRGHGRNDFAAVIKEVKSHLKGPLADKHPIFALNYRRIGTIGKQFVVEDARCERLVLTDRGLAEELRTPICCPCCRRSFSRARPLIGRFRHDLDTRKLEIKPLSIVTKTDVVRLTL